MKKRKKVNVLLISVSTIWLFIHICLYIWAGTMLWELLLFGIAPWFIVFMVKILSSGIKELYEAESKAKKENENEKKI